MAISSHPKVFVLLDSRVHTDAFTNSNTSPRLANNQYIYEMNEYEFVNLNAGGDFRLEHQPTEARGGKGKKSPA